MLADHYPRYVRVYRSFSVNNTSINDHLNECICPHKKNKPWNTVAAAVWLLRKIFVLEGKVRYTLGHIEVQRGNGIDRLCA